MELIDRVNERIITALQEKKIPWNSVPRNIVSKRRYDGVNPIILHAAAECHGFKSPWWGTFNQWQMLGVEIVPRPENVKPGGWGTRIVLYNPPNRGTMRVKPWTVFNLEQTKGGFETLRNQPPSQPDYAAADRMIIESKANIKYKLGSVAKYLYPPLDYIMLPLREQFVIGPGGLPGFFYSVFHELMHWSEARLGYKAEEAVCELRSEIGAGWLCAEYGITPITYEQNRNHQRHAELWAEMLFANPSLIFEVSEAASKGVDFLLAFGNVSEQRHNPAKV